MSARSAKRAAQYLHVYATLQQQPMRQVPGMQKRCELQIEEDVLFLPRDHANDILQKMLEPCCEGMCCVQGLRRLHRLFGMPRMLGRKGLHELKILPLAFRL